MWRRLGKTAALLSCLNAVSQTVEFEPEVGHCDELGGLPDQMKPIHLYEQCSNCATNNYFLMNVHSCRAAVGRHSSNATHLATRPFQKTSLKALTELNFQLII